MINITLCCLVARGTKSLCSIIRIYKLFDRGSELFISHFCSGRVCVINNQIITDTICFCISTSERWLAESTRIIYWRKVGIPFIGFSLSSCVEFRYAIFEDFPRYLLSALVPTSLQRVDNPSCTRNSTSRAS